MTLPLPPLPPQPVAPAFRAPALTMRIGDAERSQTCELLSQHYALGRLSLPELNERMDAAVAATTLGDLRELTADLPSPGASHSATVLLDAQQSSDPKHARHVHQPWQQTRQVGPALIGFFTACAILCTGLLLLGVTASGQEMAAVVWLACFGASVSSAGLTYFLVRRP